MPTEPLVLLANADKWLTESLESVLTQGGYRVMATAKRQQVLDLARRFLPDGVLLDTGLDQRANDNLALCRALRADPSISRAMPIILTTAGPALRVQQLEALRAGAWELRGDPLDMEELVQRITDAVSRSAAVRLRAGTSTAPAVTKPPSGARQSSANVAAPPPPSPTDLLDRARNALH